MSEVMERDAATQTAVALPPSGQLVEHQPQPRQLSVVEYAMQHGATPAEVRELVELQIQMDNHRLAMRKHDDERDRELRAEAAKNASTVAMAAFKAKNIKVLKAKLITDGPLKGKKHADLDAVVEAATLAMSECGLTASWKPVQDDKDWIRIECRITHVDGHSEAVAFGGPIDTGPGRNPIQARKSTVSYLERITMLLALGLAETDADDDGAGGPDDRLSLGDLWVGKAELAGGPDELATIWTEGLTAINKAKDRTAYNAFKAAVVKRQNAMKPEGQS